MASATVSRPMLRLIMKDMRTEAGGPLSAVIEGAVLEAFDGLNLYTARRRKSAESVAREFLPALGRLAGNARASRSWTSIAYDVVSAIWDSIELPYPDEREDLVTEMCTEAFAAAREASSVGSVAPELTPGRSSGPTSRTWDAGRGWVVKEINIGSPPVPKLGQRSGLPAKARSSAREELGAVEVELQEFASVQGLRDVVELSQFPWAVVRKRVAGASPPLSLAAMSAIADLCGQGLVDLTSPEKDPAPQGSRHRERGSRKRREAIEENPLDMLRSRIGGAERARSRGSSSRSSSGSSSSSPRRRRRHRKHGKRSVQDHLSQMEFLSRDPYTILKQQASAMGSVPPDWPFPPGETRIAPELIPQLFKSHRRAVEWAKAWAESKFQSGTPTAFCMIRHCLVIDYLIFYDSGHVNNLNVFNLAAIEVIARDVYGLIQAFGKVVRKEEAGADAKKTKVRWNLRTEYDLAESSMLSDPVVVAADRRATRALKNRTLLERAAEGRAAEGR